MRKYIKELLYSVFAGLIIISGYIVFDRCFLSKMSKEMISMYRRYHYFEDKEVLLKECSKIIYFEKMIYIIPKFWYTYVSLLIDNQQFHKAKEFLQSRTDLLKNPEILNYLKICRFAEKNGMNNEEISKSSQIFQKFEETYKNEPLHNLLKGKTVALVGNGPFERGKKSGQEIDAHDIVIRMNNYIIEGFEEDYGTRTDVWIYGFGGEDIDDKTLDNEYLYVGMTGDYRQVPLFYDFQRERLYRDMFERKINIGTVEPDFFGQLYRKYNIDPSTGLQIVYTLKQWNIDFDVYGFSFLDSKINKDHYNVHYYNNNNEGLALYRASWHNHDKEFELLSKWFDGRHIKTTEEGI